MEGGCLSDRMASLREMGQQDTQHECTSDSPPLAVALGIFHVPKTD
jgi:hypothetical protein